MYIHKNIINNKVYIGQTKLDPLQRWSEGRGYVNNKMFYQDIQKYDWYDGFSHEIVASNLTEDKASILEKDLIQKYNSSNPKYGYNHTKGGKGLTGFNHSCETKEKISNSKKGNKHTSEHKQNIGKSVSGTNNYKAKKVLQCDLDGNLVATWDYIKQAEKELNLSHGAISACCRGSQKTAYGYLWCYAP